MDPATLRWVRVGAIALAVQAAIEVAWSVAQAMGVA